MPPRIVSLLPSATEIAAALGLGEQLVGQSHECDHPPEVVARGLPVLTRSILDAGLSPAEIDTAVRDASLQERPIYAVDGELLERLEADLVLTQGVCSVCAVTPETIGTALRLVPVDALARAQRAQVLSLSATTFDGMLRDVQAVADAAGVPERGQACTEGLTQRWTAIAEGGPLTASGGRPLRVFFLEWPDPPWSAGHWVPEQIVAAGGVDVCGVAGGASKRLPWQTIAEADPDWIIAGACGYDLDTNLHHAHALLDRPDVAQLRAVREGRFWAVDANGFFSRPAPRLVRGAEILRAMFTGKYDALQRSEAAPVRPA